MCFAVEKTVVSIHYTIVLKLQPINKDYAFFDKTIDCYYSNSRVIFKDDALFKTNN